MLDLDNLDEVMDAVSDALQPAISSAMVTLALLLALIIILDVRRRAMISPVDRLLRRRRP